MAKLNPTTSATNDDRKSLATGVPSDAVPAREGVSRRDAMNMMATVAAVPMLARAGEAQACGPDARRLAWQRARDEFLSAKAALDLSHREHAQAYRRYETMRPTLDAAVRRDLPGATWTERDIRVRDLDEAYRQFCDGEGRSWWSRDPDDTKLRVKRALDAVAVYRSADQRAYSAAGCVTPDGQDDATCHRFENAETIMLQTPSPDGDALMFKLEHLFGDEVIEEEGGNLPLWDVKWVRLVMSDARRLLSGSIK